MSRASVYHKNESRYSFTAFPLHSQPITMWTKTRSDTRDMSAYSTITPTFDTCYFYNNQAGSADARFYVLTQQLLQETFASSHLIYASFHGRKQQESYVDDELWVDMPPLSIEKVVMQARDMGQGEPLAILDALADD